MVLMGVTICVQRYCRGIDQFSRLGCSFPQSGSSGLWDQSPWGIAVLVGGFLQGFIMGKGADSLVHRASPLLISAPHFGVILSAETNREVAPSDFLLM